MRRIQFSSSRWAWLLIGFVTSLVGPASYGATWVVGNTPGSDFSALQDAVSAAAAGDTIVILPGNYVGVTNMPSQKPLTIVGSGAAQTTIRSIRTSGFFGAPPIGLVLRGLTIVAFSEVVTSPHAQGSAPLGFSKGATLLYVEDCVLRGSFGGGINPVPAVALAGVVDAAFANCTFEGGYGVASFSTTSPLYHDGNSGVEIGDMASGSRVRFHGCSFVGGSGADTTFLGVDGGSGGPGLTVVGSGEVQAFGCTFEGGSTGPGAVLGSGDGTGVPGAGARIVGAKFSHQESVFVSGTDPSGTSPTPPSLLSEGVATIISVPGIAANLNVSGKTVVGQSATLQVKGTPGSMVILGIGDPLPFVPVPGVLGYFGMNPPFLFAFFAVLPVTGEISVSPLVPPLPPGVMLRTVAVQAVVAPPTGPAALSNLSVATLVVPGL